MWILAFATAFLCVGLNAGQKARLTLNGNQLVNNSMVSNQQLYYSYYSYYYGTTSSYTPVRCELTGNSSAASRQWYSPTGAALPSRNMSSSGGYGQSLVQATGVDLYSGGAYSITLGVHRCDIVDGNGTLYRLYVAIYNDPSLVGSSTASSGPSNFWSVQFQLVTPLPVDPPVYQLACISTYSPATTVQWMYNGSPANTTNFATFQLLTDPLSSTYKSILVVTGKMAGNYSCTVTTLCAPACGNFVGPRSVTSSLYIPAPPAPPTQVTVSQTGPTTLRVSWNPGSGSSLGYYILSGTEGNAVYTTSSSVLPYYDMSITNNLITVAAVGTYLTSSFTPVAPIITVTTSNSITLTWRQPVDPFGIGAVDRYEVYYGYVGPCPAIIHRGAEVLDSSATSLTILGMQKFSTYNLTITAVKNGGSSLSNVQIVTSSSIPDAPPSAVSELARSPTTLTVGWNAVPCLFQNSLIVKYLVRYGLPYGVKTTTEATLNSFTATGLTPYTSYMFEVAAVNSAGLRGPFSAPFIMDTTLGPPTILKNQVLSPTSALLSWMPSDGDSLTRYSVSYTYKGPCGEGVVGGAGVVSTGSTQYTIQGLEEYSTYALSVRAERGGQVTMSNTTVTTWAAVPSAPPSGLVQISKTSTGVTVAWEPVPCTSRNSDISKYRVRYNSTVQQDSFAMTFSATGLDPYTDYSFQVAAVNTDGLVGPYSAPLVVKTLQPLPPVVTITSDGSSPTDQGNFSMTCNVYVPSEALGTLTVRWLGPLGPQVALSSTVESNVGGETVELDLVFSPIHSEDGGWYTCNVTFELYPQAGASSKVKVTVQSDALFQVQLGPTDNCVQWPWSTVPINGGNVGTEYKVDQVQKAVFATVSGLLSRNRCSCEVDSVDWVYSCQTSSSSVVFKYALHLTSDHCNCSGSRVVSIMDQWVESAGTVRMGRYQLRANSNCASTRIASFDDPDCKKKPA
ncbi:hypothetical protein EMCRGX_G019195 [Ephydatia muelleri]